MSRFQITNSLAAGFATLFLTCALLGAPASSAAAQLPQALDSSKVPRVPGGKEVYASAATTIYTAPDSVAKTGTALRKLLATAGWRQFEAPFSQRAEDPSMEMMTFKKETLALSVFISVASAQGNKTSVQYSPSPLPNNLPFPPDATGIEFDPNRPYLVCQWGTTVDKALTFFREQMPKVGWTLRPADKGISYATDEGGYAYYLREGQDPLMLTVTREEKKGPFKIEIKQIPAKALLAEAKEEPPSPAPAPPAPPTSTAKSPAKVGSNLQMPRTPAAAEKMADDLLGEARRALDDATADIEKATKDLPQPAAKPAKQPLTKLAAMPDSPAPIPVPETAADVEFDGDAGQLEFNSESTVPSLAAFYRGALKPLGWKEQSTPISSDKMVVLEFAKGEENLSLTIMQLGDHANISASGAALLKKMDAPTAPTGDGDAPDATELVAEDMSGLPVPTRHSMAGSESTPFRRGVDASVPASLAAVLEFYRNELTARDWKENASAAVVKDDRAQLSFTTPEGPAVLKLGRKADETTVNLSIKQTAAAKKAGVLPKSGQARLIFGNMTPSEAQFTINKKTIKVAGGVGAKKPDGPSLDLPPGKYKYTFRAGNKPAQADEIEVFGDETWGVIVGPGGALPLQVY